MELKLKSPDVIWGGGVFFILGIWFLGLTLYSGLNIVLLVTSIINTAIGSFFIIIAIIGQEAFWSRWDKLMSKHINTITEDDLKKAKEEWEKHGN